MANVEIPVLSLGPHSNGMLVSPWEFDVAEFETWLAVRSGQRSAHRESASAARRRDPNEELGRWLRNYQEDDPEGSALDFTVSEQTVHIGPHRRRVDRAIWAGLGRLPEKHETPTIAVEFVSEGRRNEQRDYEIKRDEYQNGGCARVLDCQSVRAHDDGLIDSIAAK